jgi:hypothetical protein
VGGGGEVTMGDARAFVRSERMREARLPPFEIL